MGYFAADGVGNRRDTIGIGVQQIAGMDGNASHAYGRLDSDDVAVAVRADHPIAEGGKADDGGDIRLLAGGDEALRLGEGRNDPAVSWLRAVDDQLAGTVAAVGTQGGR